MQTPRGKRLRRVLWFLLIVFGLALLALLGYSLRFDPDAEDLPGQRSALADRTRAPATAAVDGAAALADLRALADPAMEGRAVGTPGGARARDYLLQRFRALELVPATSAGFEQPFTFTPRQRRMFWQKAPGEAPAPVQGVNLVARIPGTVAPAQHILVSAHYDHLGVRGGKTYFGADDNASGVAALLAVAAHFKAHPPRHSILIVAFDAEEKGLRGARAFVAARTHRAGAELRHGLAQRRRRTGGRRHARAPEAARSRGPGARRRDPDPAVRARPPAAGLGRRRLDAQFGPRRVRGCRRAVALHRRGGPSGLPPADRHRGQGGPALLRGRRRHAGGRGGRGGLGARCAPLAGRRGARAMSLPAPTWWLVGAAAIALALAAALFAFLSLSAGTAYGRHFHSLSLVQRRMARVLYLGALALAIGCALLALGLGAWALRLGLTAAG
jgi:hypothetical protein